MVGIMKDMRACGVDDKMVRDTKEECTCVRDKRQRRSRYIKDVTVVRFSNRIPPGDRLKSNSRSEIFEILSLVGLSTKSLNFEPRKTKFIPNSSKNNTKCKSCSIYFFFSTDCNVRFPANASYFLLSFINVV